MQNLGFETFAGISRITPVNMHLLTSTVLMILIGVHLGLNWDFIELHMKYLKINSLIGKAYPGKKLNFKTAKKCFIFSKCLVT